MLLARNSLSLPHNQVNVNIPSSLTGGAEAKKLRMGVQPSSHLALWSQIATGTIWTAQNWSLTFTHNQGGCFCTIVL